MINSTFYIFCGRLSNALFLFLLTLAVSRLLGPSLFGVYSFLTTVVLTGTFVANYGLDILMVKEVVKDQSQGKNYLCNILALKIVTSLITILLITIVFMPFSLASSTRYLLLLLSFSLLFNSLSQTLWHYGDGFEKFIFHSILWSMTNLIKAIIGISTVFFFRDINLLIWGLVFAEAISFVFACFLIKYSFGNYSLSFDLAIWYDLITKSTPLALWVTLSALYFRVDIIMLKLMKGDEMVGWYSAAYKLMEVFTILPGSIVMVLFPSLVKDYHSDLFKFKKKINKSLVTFSFIGILVAVFLSIFSKNIIMIIFGDSFSPSIIALQILAWVLLFLFVNYLLSYILVSIGKEKDNIFNLLIVTAVNIGLNLLLIPEYGHIGAAWATLISEVILMALYGFAIKPIMTCADTGIIRRDH